MKRIHLTKPPRHPLEELRALRTDARHHVQGPPRISTCVRRQRHQPRADRRLYRVPVNDIFGIIYFEPAQAVKITMRRRVLSGALGDGDIYGAQQHAPLLDIEFPA